MTGERQQRVMQAFDHVAPDRTPLFEIFQPFQPIHWDIAGRTIGTDEAMAWDAMADGVAPAELAEAFAWAQFEVCRFFGLDMVRLNGFNPNYVRPVRTGPGRWTRQGIPYLVHPRTHLVVPDNPGALLADSRKHDPEAMRRQIQDWNGQPAAVPFEPDPVSVRVRQLASEAGIEWVYMAEIGTGTGVAFWPPFFLIWLYEEPELVRRWLAMQVANGFPRTRALVEQGHAVVAMGGDVSSDKGPFISPAHYREFVLPVIQAHVRLIQAAGAKAVYTSDGNHWAIQDEFFIQSGIDGYKEVDYAAGMTMERLIEAGLDRRICIIGNLDARHTLCHASEAEVRAFTIRCLELGRQSPGGHILHASHSVHEDVKVRNYYAAVEAYRDFFGLGPLPQPAPRHLPDPRP